MRYVLRMALVSLFFLALSGNGIGLALKAEAATPKVALRAQGGEFINNMAQKALKVLNNKNISFEQRREEYHQILRSSFDLPTIGRFVIGSAWYGATPAQRKEYMELFENLIVKIYGERLNVYNGEKFNVLRIEQESPDDFVVSSEIIHSMSDQSPTHVDWRVRRADGKFKITDIIIEGVSQSVTQREEYASIIDRDGGRIDGLLALMRAQLQGPAPNPNPNPDLPQNQG